jgi:SulP family sulfate permease
MLKPKILSTLKEYNREQFVKDLIAGIVVGIVALPLAIAFAIASGVSPEKGLYTAIIAGFIISALGGSRVQIGGPTGAFIVIVFGIVQKYGIDGLTIATFLAGIILMIMGFVRFGSIIKFVPHPLIVGFTSAIALIIFSSQIKDFFGLTLDKVPSEFIDKWSDYFGHITSLNPYSVFIAAATVFISFGFSKITTRLPGSLIAILLFTGLAAFLKWPVETIGSRFGAIPATLPSPVIPHITLDVVRHLIQPAFTIALLGGIESLLSAVVADGMIGGKHRSNMELVAQGVANIFSAIFGGIPATGAIARTATNVKNGGRTPVAGIVHALVLLLIMLLVGRWAVLIPMSCLAGILVVVAYNMSEWRSFVSIAKGPGQDALILLTTFFLTVLVDLTVAIEVGMVLSAFLFMKRMSEVSHVNSVTDALSDQEEGYDPMAINKYKVPLGVEVYEIEGPLFFGAASKFMESIKLIEKSPRVLIIRMRHVPFIDSTGVHTLAGLYKQSVSRTIGLILSGVNEEVYQALDKSDLIEKIGKENILPEIESALRRAAEILDTKPRGDFSSKD